MKSCFPRLYLSNKHLLRMYSLLGTRMHSQYIRGTQEMLTGAWMNEWTNERPSHRCNCRGHWGREACPSLHFSSFYIWVLPTPAQGCRAPGFSPSPVSLLGFQPRSSDKEAVIRTHPLCITIVRGYKGCSKRMPLTCIWKVSSPFTPIKDLFLFCPV